MIYSSFKIGDLVLFDNPEFVYEIIEIGDKKPNNDGSYYLNIKLKNAFRIGIFGIENKIKKFSRTTYLCCDKDGKITSTRIKPFSFEVLQHFVQNLVKIPAKRSKYGSTWNLDHLTTEDLEIELDKRLSAKKD